MINIYFLVHTYGMRVNSLGQNMNSSQLIKLKASENIYIYLDQYYYQHIHLAINPALNQSMN